MKKVFNRVKKKYKQAIGGLSYPLPRGMTQFDDFVNVILLTYDIDHNDSYKQAIATMIMHLPPTQTKAPLKYFADSIKKAQSNQIAYQVIQDINHPKTTVVKDETPPQETT